MEQEGANKKRLTPLQARLKAESYCAYQERSQQEVRDKLYDYGLHTADVEQVIAYLIENNFLNEERFAKAYVSGKFRIKKWGKQKIIQGLKLKRVSPPLIKIALKEIDDSVYYATLVEVLEKKEALLKETDPYKRKNKLLQHALSRGYENSLIWEVLKDKGIE